MSGETPLSISELWMSLEQVLSQPHLEEAYKQERALSDNLMAIVLVLDAEGRIVRFNRFMEKFSGYRLDEVQGQNWLKTFFMEEDQPLMREVIEHILSGGTASSKFSPILTRNGDQRQVFWRFRAFPDAEGKKSGILIIGQDLTVILHAQKQTVQTERLAVIGRTIASVSHEARNELHALKLGLELLRHTLDDRDKALKIINQMEEDQARLTRLFEDVRGFAAPMRLERSHHDLSEIWQKAWASLDSLREGRNAMLHEEVSAPTITCVVDSFRLEEVFRNLFENSLAACADPVEIDITCTPTNLDNQKAILIRLRDNGPGLTPDQQEKLFEPFFTTKSRGTGLGMALAKQVIDAHGGTISVNREKSKGAEFLITLPLAGGNSNGSSRLSREEVNP